MKLTDIKQLSAKEFVERYPFTQTVDYNGEKCFIENGDEYHKAGDPVLEFGPGLELWGWNDLLYSWAEKVKPYYDKMSDEMKKNFYILELKEKYGDMRLYLSFRPVGEFAKIQEYTDMVEHLSTFTCSRCGHLSRGSQANKLLAWRTRGWISYYCKNCAKKLLREDNRNYHVKVNGKKFKQLFNSTYKRIEGDWFARFTSFDKDKKEQYKYDCRELFEGLI